MRISLTELAQQFGLQHQGNDNHEVTGVATLAKAQSQQVSFLANVKYSKQLKQTQAGIVILSDDFAAEYQGNKLISKDPYLAFAKISAFFQNQQKTFKGIHNTAIVAKSAQIDANVSIGPYSIIGEDTRIKSGTSVDAHVTIGDNCRIGMDCWIKPQVVIADDCCLGDRVLLHPGAIIGADGFGLARDKDGWVKVPQLGAVRIGDDCEIGANTSIDRGTMDDTILENDVRLDNQIQIAHNVTIGAHTVMAGCSAVAGSAKIGKNCLVGGGVGILGHLEVCDNVTLQSMALVTHSIRKPGSYSSITPLQKTQDWRKNAVRFKSLDKMAKRLHKLEREND
ncbi:MAG TPA: UDP-3-O-(3-hydroxymyristoyl)glucosamine N-acyltransferase [Oceanospirillales bacterium]|nr:UDP-3-O-(3-hydroxymyristoyl)glucosamine N-acyltransferase [Oceanospirillales bacterium]